jgi:hypothetical protein
MHSAGPGARVSYRRNADEGLRRLERAASRGDPEAVAALEHRRRRLMVGGAVSRSP